MNTTTTSTTANKPAAIRYTEAELRAAFASSMGRVFNDFSKNAKTANAKRDARIAAACRR